MPRSVENWIGKTDDTAIPPRVVAGASFGHWTVVSKTTNGGPRTRWICRCRCGIEKPVFTAHLISGRSRGCAACRRARKEETAHSHPLYRVWCNIIQRCTNPRNGSYQNYGGRGVTVCERWRNSFWNFASDVGPRPAPHLTIDRIDNDLGYEPLNVRWADRQMQSLNRRGRRLVKYNGEIMPLAEACRQAGVNYGTAKWRLNNGRSDEDALS